MSPLPSHFELRQRKAIEKAEEERRREKARTEERGLREALARYWEVLGEFLVRAEELGLHPSLHQP